MAALFEPSQPAEAIVRSCCMDKNSPTEVQDNVEASRFELDCGSGQIAFAPYRREGDVLTVPYSEVPRALRGKGFGEKLTLGLLAQARAEGLKVRPLCSFVEAVMRRHKEYSDLRA
jgi:predicted GNAT family acetyltransferase